MNVIFWASSFSVRTTGSLAGHTSRARLQPWFAGFAVVLAASLEVSVCCCIACLPNHAVLGICLIGACSSSVPLPVVTESSASDHLSS
ncbi:hypothetical protein ACOMHN_005903 [Nucella lapillus]